MYCNVHGYLFNMIILGFVSLTEGTRRRAEVEVGVGVASDNIDLYTCVDGFVLR